MPRLSAEEKVSLAAEFVLQAPPGEVNDVLNDLRMVISDDQTLEAGLLPALEEYNVKQLVTVDVPGEKYKMLISAAGRIQSASGARYLDPRGGKTYAVNHMAPSLSDPEPYEPDEELETFRTSLQKATDAYLAAHYLIRAPAGAGDQPSFGDSACAVFSPLGSGGGSGVGAEELARKVWTVEIVSSKYKPNNFWAGRWRSSYEVEPEKLEVRGKVAVDVHYYEQGNVQLHTTFTPRIPLPSTSVTADQILTLIADQEGKYHGKLSESFEKMRDGGFRGLRRMLPVTRGKMDWDKVLGYKLGQELAGARSPPISSS